MTRLVVVLCGPPGAGKTTAARASGLTVYDADDPQWTSQAQFTQAIARLAEDPTARAVVIRTAPTSTARAKWRRITQATHCLLVWADQDVCASRIRARGRNVARDLAALRRWHERHERADHVRAFAGWDVLGNETPPPQRKSPRPTKGTTAAGYGYRHRKLRAHWQERMDAGEAVRCWRPGCGRLIDPSDWHLGHDDRDRSRWRGPECPSCNLAAAAAKTNAIRRAEALNPAGEPTSRTW